MAPFNPYLDYFRALPEHCRRKPGEPAAMGEHLFPEWLAFKTGVARHFSWAVPSSGALAAIGRRAEKILEVGAGSGYWAWLLRQAGLEVIAVDAAPLAFAWLPVAQADERAVASYAGDALFLCWPPWGSDMAFNALTLHRGPIVIFVGEWMGGTANARFFALLSSKFKLVERAAIPQWQGRDDWLFIFERR
jgi:SAM-dependent methyltransferase